MEFTKSFDEMISMVEKVFDLIGVDPTPMYYESPEWDIFEEACDNNNIKIAHGLTKFVLFFDDFVIKIPFKGNYSTWVSNDNEDRYNPYSINHCEYEVDVYDALCSREIGFLLCPTVYIGQLGAVKLYAQPKCEPFTYDKHSPSEQSYNMTEEFDYYECTADDDDVVALFAEEFGYDAPNILDMLDEEGIRDVHQGNVGFLNGKLIIFDFCGYHY